jgi:hypothetical protein
MENPEHLAKLKEGVKAWNQWREDNRDVAVDLSHADLGGADLSRANLSLANLSRANLLDADLSAAKLNFADFSDANLCGANLNEAELYGANLSGANLVMADVRNSDLRRANLVKANLSGATFVSMNLSDANLSGANLSAATLVQTNLEGADLTGCSVYGVSAWDVRLEGAVQSNLVITPHGVSAIEVDNLEVAQFIYLLLNNKRIRHVIDTITSKVVLILGRFTPERKAVLDALRDELRKRDYLPVLFDFEKPNSKDLTGTVSTLANMARFIIADLTDPSCSPYEVGMTVPGTKVPMQAIILDGQRPFAMFKDLLDYPWVLPPYKYQSAEALLANLNDVIAPAEAKAKELAEGRKQFDEL